MTDDDLLCMDLTFVPALLFNQPPAIVDVELSWDPDVPPRITMVIKHHGHKDVTWALSRELIADGLDRGAAGHGDVAVLPDFTDPRCVEVVLSSPSGRVALVIEREHLSTYLVAINRYEHPEWFADAAGAAS